MATSDEEIAAFLATPARAPQVSDEEITSFLGVPAAPRPPTPVGKIESLLRGGKQGLTLGFGDELTGFVESLFTEKSYSQARDEARAADAAAKEANPWTYGAGNVLGGVGGALIPGLGVARGATAGAAALKGLASGAIAGLGGSDADLATEEGRGQAVRDVATGAAMGAVGGAVGQKITRALTGAPARATESAVKELQKGVQNSTLTRAFGPMGKEGVPVRYEQIKTAANATPALRRALKQGQPERALDIAEKRLEAIGPQIGAIYEKATTASPGVSAAPLAERLVGVADEFATTATDDARNLVLNTAGKLGERWKDKPIPIDHLHKELQAWQEVANKAAKSFSDLTPRQEASFEIARVLKDTLHGEIERVARAGADLGISLDALKALNRDYSTWTSIQKILSERARRAFTGAKEGKTLFSQGVVATARRGAASLGDWLDYNAVAPAVQRVGVQRVERATRGLAPATSTSSARLRADDARDAIRAALTPSDDEESLSGL